MKESQKPTISDEEVLRTRLRDRANNPPVFRARTIGDLQVGEVFGDMEKRAARTKELLDNALSR